MQAAGLMHPSIQQLDDVENAILSNGAEQQQLQADSNKRFWLVARRMLPGQITQLGSEIDSNLYEVYQVLEKHPMVADVPGYGSGINFNADVTSSFAALAGFGQQTDFEGGALAATAAKGWSSDARKEKKSDAIRRLDFTEIRRRYAAFFDAPGGYYIPPD